MISVIAHSVFVSIIFFTTQITEKYSTAMCNLFLISCLRSIATRWHSLTSDYYWNANNELLIIKCTTTLIIWTKPWIFLCAPIMFLFALFIIKIIWFCQIYYKDKKTTQQPPSWNCTSMSSVHPNHALT